jgi:hypothetical protein
MFANVTGKAGKSLCLCILNPSIRIAYGLIGMLFALAGCGPRANVPPRPSEPVTLPGALPAVDDRAQLARSLAPVLFLQRDEWFPLERVVAVVHPTRRIVAYHLLWRDDVHGSWIPFTVPTDQEIIWVGYDATGAPTDIWAFWHGKILHTDWRDRGTAAIDVQWGKHGSLPRGTIQSDLPGLQKLNSFYAFTWLGVWDMLLGRLTRPGPSCFCYDYDRYREFIRPLLLGERVDVVAATDDPKSILTAVFGTSYSKKRAWP